MGGTRPKTPLQCDVPAKRCYEKTDKTWLHLCNKQMEVNDEKCEGQMGPIGAQIRKKIWPWILECHLALENPEAKVLPNRGLWGHDWPIMETIWQLPANEIGEKQRNTWWKSGHTGHSKWHGNRRSMRWTKVQRSHQKHKRNNTRSSAKQEKTI